jgi:hypothetical protein
MTMAFFNSSSPVYKKVASRDSTQYTPSGSNGLASMFGSLLGGTTPVYKTREGRPAAREPSSSGLLRIFVGASPSYKTAEQLTPELVDEDLGEALDETVDAVEAEDADDACPPPIDTVVLL